MINIINGIDGWKFIDMSATSVADAFNYFESFPEKTSFFLDSAKCDPGILEIITDHQNIDLLKAVHLLNTWADISALECCKNISNLSIGYEKSVFDFSFLPELTSIGGTWSKWWSGLETCKMLSDFSVAGFDGSFSDIPNLAKLKNISLSQPKFSSLVGIEQARELLSLRILRGAKLADISEIQFLQSNLVSVEFDNCKNISDYSALLDFKKIQKLVISDCKKYRFNKVCFHFGQLGNFQHLWNGR